MRTSALRFWKGLWLASVLIVPVSSAVFLLAVPAAWRGTICAGLGVILLVTMGRMAAMSRRKPQKPNEGQTNEGHP